MEWFKGVGVWDVLTIAGCALGVLISVTLGLLEVFRYGPSLNIRIPNSDISKWIGNGMSEITNGQMSQADQVNGNRTVERYYMYYLIEC